MEKKQELIIFGDLRHLCKIHNLLINISFGKQIISFIDDMIIGLIISYWTMLTYIINKINSCLLVWLDHLRSQKLEGVGVDYQTTS